MWSTMTLILTGERPRSREESTKWRKKGLLSSSDSVTELRIGRSQYIHIENVSLLVKEKEQKKSVQISGWVAV